MILLLIFIPIIGSLCIMPITENSKKSQTKIKKIALFTSLVNFLISILLLANFDSNTNQIQFVYEYTQLNFCHFYLGIDGISLYFVLLTTFLTPIALLSNYKNITENTKTFFISFLILETLQICLFTVLDLFLFYIFFESILPILFIIIILYGSGKARIRSALLFFLYTFSGSLFMLLAILQIYSYIGSTDIQLISLYEISLDSQKILWLAFLLAFAVKTPLWPFTGWLYRAHADSPLAGSILLAGTILKFSTYGILRVLINLLPDATNYFSPLIQTLAIITLIYASLATIIQSDTKVLVAYSSIAHMAVITLGLFSNTIIGIEGAILLALAHGLVSPALFICVGGIIYDRYHTRIIQYIRGLVTYMPVFTILFFIFTLANTGIPLSLNFLGEQLSLIGIWERNPIIALFGASGIVLSACYSIYLYNRLSYGVFSPHLKPVIDINRIEFILLISLLIPTILLGIFPNFILDFIHVSITNLLFQIPLFFCGGIILYTIINILIFRDHLLMITSMIKYFFISLGLLCYCSYSYSFDCNFFINNLSLIFIFNSGLNNNKLNNISLRYYSNHKLINSNNKSFLKNKLDLNTNNESYKFFIYLFFTFLVIIIYKYFSYLTIIKSFVFIITFFTFYLIWDYVLEGFKYSKNIFINKLQILNFKILFIILILSIIYIIYYIFDIPFFNTIECSSPEDKSIINVNENDDNYNFSIKKEIVHKTLENISTSSKIVLENVVPNVGVAAAAGTATAAMIKATSGLPPTQRVLIAGVTAGVTSMTTQAGMMIGAGLVNQTIKNSPHSNPNIDRLPSPTDDQFSANSPLETSPIETLLISQFIMNICIILVIIIILYIIISRYIIKYNMGNISNLIEKYMSKKIYDKYNHYISKSFIFSDRFLLIIFIYNIILLFILLFLNFFVTAELLANLDNYINVYNNIHKIDKGSLLLIIGLNNKNRNKI